METYTDEHGGDCGEHGKHEEERDDFGRALGVRAEDVVNLLELSVAQGLLVLGGSLRRGVELNLHIEDGSVEALGGSEGGEHERSGEGLRGAQVLDW